MNALALNETRDINFLYLNRDGRWRDFEWHGLRLADGDGALTLATVPRLLSEMPGPPAGAQTSDGLGGLAIGPDGAVYFSASARNRISKIDPCDGAVAPAPCMGGAGHRPTQFLTPRGLMFHPQRRALFVADSGNHRIQIFAIDTLQLVDVWGQTDFLASPQPGSEVGFFNDPRSLAVDRAGNVYVLDYGNRRAQKFDLRGRSAPEFLQTIEAELEQRHLQLRQPSEVAVNLRGESTEIYILDADSKSIFVFDEHGHYLELLELNLQRPAGLAVKRDTLYVGDWERQIIFKFERNRLKRDTDKREWVPVGEAQGFRGRTAAFALTAKDDLWAHPGGDGVPLRLAEHGGYVKRGFLWGGPFNNPSVRRDQWHRLRATVARLAPGAHLQLFIYATSGNDTPPTPASPDVPPWRDRAEDLSMRVTAPHGPGEWRGFPLDTKECLFPGAPSDRVWVGCELIGAGLTSPALSQMRLDFDHETYLQFLPSIYRENPQSAALLARFLTLFESLFVDVETEIRGLAGLFDPRSAPAEFLSWLAGWLALEVAEKWDEGRKREAIAKAFDLYAKRGTVEGLRESLRFFAGVEARIEEPLLQSNWWALADEEAPAERKQTSLLGFTTMLVASEAQGAVVGTTATLDQSRLITEEEIGAPLFDDLAHRFSVQLYRGAAFGEETLETVRALLDREKPAHTDYHICIIEPNFRIGFQSRVGIDTVVAGPAPPARLAPEMSEAGLVLGGEPAGRIGRRSGVGQTTRLGFRSFEAEHSERDCDSE